MTVKAHQEETNIVLPIMTDHRLSLRKVVSDVTNELTKLDKDLDTILEIDETIIVPVECDCCGLKEECTKEYISRIRNSYSGKWVCGLCSEAVKERLNHHGPLANIEEAMMNHTNFVRDFNNTTRANPKLSLAWAMRDIAKKSGEKRRINISGGIKIMRSASCVPRIDVNMKQ